MDFSGVYGLKTVFIIVVMIFSKEFRVNLLAGVTSYHLTLIIMT